MIIIGGLDDYYKPLNDVNSLDLSKMSWVSIYQNEEL